MPHLTSVSIPPSPGSFRPPSEDSDARFELLGETLQRLIYQVQRQEDRQLAQHQQIVRFEGTLQGLQEDRETMGFFTSAARLQTLEKGQTAVAAGAQRAMQLAMKAAEAQQTMSDRQDEVHGRNSHELSLCTGRVEQLEQHVQQLEDQLERLSLSKQKESNWSQRLDQYEAVDRRLHSLEAESQERCHQLQNVWEKNHQDFEQRLKGLNTLVAKHSQKMEAIDVALGELQASAADVLFEGCLQENQAKLSLEASAEGELGAVAKMHEQMVRVEEPQKEEICEAAIGELRRRLDDLSELLDEQRLTQLRHFSMALPEINNKLELLGRQAAECSAKTEAFEVRLDLTRTNLDTQEQRLHALSSRFEKTQRRDCPGLDDLVVKQEEEPLKQHFDIKVTKLADAAKILQKVAKEGLVTPVTPKRKEEMIKKTPSFGDRETDDCLKELETAVEADESQASLSGDDALPFRFSMSTAVRRSISGFTGC